MIFADAHCDTFTEMYINRKIAKDYDFSLDKVSKNKYLQLAAFFIDTSERNTLKTPSRKFEEYYNYTVDILNQDNNVKICVSEQDIRDSLDKGKTAIILTVENGELLSENATSAEILYDKGIRLITLVWNNSNSLGVGAYWKEYSSRDTGLTEFGKKCVRKLDSIGIIPDGAHLSERGFYDLAENTVKPLFISHSACKSICKNDRNLTDMQLKIVGETGGYVGIVLFSEFLSDMPENVTNDTVLKHIEHAISICGEECVGFGSDMDGFVNRYNGYHGVNTLFDIAELMLKKNYNENTVKKICGQNLLNALKVDL